MQEDYHAKYAEIDEKEFLFLLQDYRSDDFKKARRNLIFASFIVIIIFLLDKSLTELRVFGLSLEDTEHPNKILALALMLILYWAGMVIIYFNRDNKAYSERKQILENQIDSYKRAFIKLEEIKESAMKQGKPFPIAGYEKQEDERLKFVFRLHNDQKNRTESLSFWNKIIGLVEIGLPFIMAYVATWMLVYEIFS